jgi:outer membrane lipoprotein-sorting protein
MRRVLGAGLAVAAAVSLTACGAKPPLASGPAGPEVWRTSLAREARAIRTVDATLTVTTGSGPEARTVRVHLLADGSRWRETLREPNGMTLTLVNDGTNGWSWETGGSHYAVGPAPMTSGLEVRWLGPRYADFVAAVRFDRVAVRHGSAEARFHGTLPDVGPVSGTFWFRAASGVPVRLTWNAVAGGETVAVQRYVVNGPLAAATFSATPPAGATPVETGTAVMARLDALEHGLPFALLIPSLKAHLTLEDVSTAVSGAYGTEVILRYRTAGGDPLLVTEYGTGGLPPAPATGQATAVTVGKLTVDEAPLALGGTWAAASDGTTTVIAEGPAAAVTAFYQDLPAPPSAS